MCCRGGGNSLTRGRRAGNTTAYNATIQLQTFPSYTPPAINFSRIVDQTSIFNWSQGAAYKLSGNEQHDDMCARDMCARAAAQHHCPNPFVPSRLPIIRHCYSVALLMSTTACALAVDGIGTGLNTFVPWEMVAPPEFCPPPPPVSNCTQPPCPPPPCIAIYAVIPQVAPPIQGSLSLHNISCVNVSWCVGRAWGWQQAALTPPSSSSSAS